MENRQDTIWTSEDVVSRYITGVRAAIPLAKEQLDIMVHLLKTQKHPIKHVLDLGCGDGALAHVIADTFPDATITCLDFSEPMLEAAKKRLSAYSSQTRFICADYATDTYLESLQSIKPFDAIVSGFSIHHQPDKRKHDLYQQIFNMLHPGCFFINIEHVKSASPFLESMWHDLFLESFAMAEKDKKNPRSRKELETLFYEDESWIKEREANKLASVHDQCQWLSRIGFTDVDCYLKIYELAVFGGRKP